MPTTSWDQLPSISLEEYHDNRYVPGFFDETVPVVHRRQIYLLTKEAARQVSADAGRAGVFDIPTTDRTFLRDWTDEEVAQARHWLYERGIPFSTQVYLLYDGDTVLKTTWKIVVRYWDTFAWNVGVGMAAVDSSLQWTVWFDHEDAILFSSNRSRNNILSRDSDPV